MIEDIEELCPELRVEGAGDFLDVVILKHGTIKIQKAWPNERVPPQVPAQGDRIRNRKALRLDVMDRIPRIN